MYHRNRTSGRNGSIDLKKYYNPKLAVSYIPNDVDYDVFCTFIRDRTVKTLSMSFNKTPDEIFFILRKIGEIYLEFYDHSIGSSIVDNIDKLVFQDFVYGKSIEQLVEDYTRQPQEIFKNLRHVGLIYEQYYQTFHKGRKLKK